MLNAAGQVDCEPLLQDSRSCQWCGYCERLLWVLFGRDLVRGPVLPSRTAYEEFLAAADLERAVLEIQRRIQMQLSLPASVFRVAKQASTPSSPPVRASVRYLLRMSLARAFRKQGRTAPRSSSFFSQAKVNARNAP